MQFLCNESHKDRQKPTSWKNLKIFEWLQMVGVWREHKSTRDKLLKERNIPMWCTNSKSGASQKQQELLIKVFLFDPSNTNHRNNESVYPHASKCLKCGDYHNHGIMWIGIKFILRLIRLHPPRWVAVPCQRSRSLHQCLVQVGNCGSLSVTYGNRSLQSCWWWGFWCCSYSEQGRCRNVNVLDIPLPGISVSLQYLNFSSEELCWVTQTM